MAASRVVAWSLLVAAVASIDLSLLAARPAGSFAGSADMLASVVLRPGSRGVPGSASARQWHSAHPAQRRASNSFVVYLC